MHKTNRGEKKKKGPEYINGNVAPVSVSFPARNRKKYGYYAHGRKIKIEKERRKRRTKREEEKPKIGRIDNPDE